MARPSGRKSTAGSSRQSSVSNRGRSSASQRRSASGKQSAVRSSRRTAQSAIRGPRVDRRPQYTFIGLLVATLVTTGVLLANHSPAPTTGSNHVPEKQDMALLDEAGLLGPGNYKDTGSEDWTPPPSRTPDPATPSPQQPNPENPTQPPKATPPPSKKPTRPTPPVAEEPAGPKPFKMQQVPYLESTTDDQRYEMGQLIKNLQDIDNTRLSDDARRKIKSFGRVVIPILLNAFLELDMNNEDDRIRGNMIAACLRAYNDDRGFGYAHGPGSTAKGLSEARKKWFQWWDGQSK